MTGQHHLLTQLETVLQVGRIALNALAGFTQHLFGLAAPQVVEFGPQGHGFRAVRGHRGELFLFERNRRGDLAHLGVADFAEQTGIRVIGQSGKVTVILQRLVIVFFGVMNIGELARSLAIGIAGFVSLVDHAGQVLGGFTHSDNFFLRPALLALFDQLGKSGGA